MGIIGWSSRTGEAEAELRRKRFLLEALLLPRYFLYSKTVHIIFAHTSACLPHTFATDFRIIEEFGTGRVLRSRWHVGLEEEVS